MILTALDVYSYLASLREIIHTLHVKPSDEECNGLKARLQSTSIWSSDRPDRALENCGLTPFPASSMIPYLLWLDVLSYFSVSESVLAQRH